MWIKDYRYAGNLNDELIGLENRRWGRQVWVEAKTRKGHSCVITGALIKKGDIAYRPAFTNKGNRYERISLKGMSSLKSGQ